MATLAPVKLSGRNSSKDSDGAELSVQLYADENKRLLELELIRRDSTDLLGPGWATLQLQ